MSKLLEKAESYVGLQEFDGSENNPVILHWAEGLGKGHRYDEDSIPWCGLFVAHVLQSCGYNFPSQFLAAKSFLNVGVPIDKPEVGCLVIFKRRSGGHVGFVHDVISDNRYIMVLGGNQSDSVSIAKFKTDNVLGYRRIEEKGSGKTLHNTDADGATKNVKDIVLFGDGDMFQLLCKASSQNEGWMKSTKAMEIPGQGCVLQVTTQQGDNVAEAVTYVPGAKIQVDTDEEDNVIGRRLVNMWPTLDENRFNYGDHIEYTRENGDSGLAACVAVTHEKVFFAPMDIVRKPGEPSETILDYEALFAIANEKGIDDGFTYEILTE